MSWTTCAVHADEDLVLVGHGTAWTIVLADSRGGRLARWRALRTPDVWTIEV